MPEWNLVSCFNAQFEQFRSFATSPVLLAAMAVSAFAQTGCSGIASNQLGSQLLQEQPILLPEDAAAMPTGAALTESPDQVSSDKPEPVTPVPFRFSEDVPQPNVIDNRANAASNDFPVSQNQIVAEVVAPSANVLRPLPEAQPVEQPVEQPVALGGNEKEARATKIQLVAHTEPVAEVVDSSVKRKAFPLANTSPQVVALADAAARGDVDSKIRDVGVIKVDALDGGLRTGGSTQRTPQLSPAQLRQVTGADDWTATPSDAGTIDLTDIEMPDPADAVTPRPLTSSEHLNQTVELLKHELLQSSTPRDSLRVSVRLLELLQRKLASASQLDVPMTSDEVLYWQQQVDALALMMQTQPVATDGASDQQVHQSTFAAIERLEQATDHLRALAGLQIRGGQLCSQISGFGQYRLLDSNTFRVGDQALVYVEVENFESQQILVADHPQWTTRLQASYAIYDSTGRAVQQEQYPLIEDVARNRRRDFYVHLPLTVGDLDPGTYELQIVVEDANRSASATLPVVKFSVK